MGCVILHSVLLQNWEEQTTQADYMRTRMRETLAAGWTLEGNLAEGRRIHFHGAWGEEEETGERNGTGVERTA